MTLDEWGERLEKNPDPQLEQMLKDWWAHNDNLVERIDRLQHDIIHLQHLIFNRDGKIKELEDNLEGIELERNQYLQWFELHSFEVPKILKELYGITSP